MGAKILAAVIIVVILLVGVFLIAPNAFKGIVPEEYMPDEDEIISDTEIHWQTRVTASMTEEDSSVVGQAETPL